MATVGPAPSAEPGRWLLRPDVDWWDLVRYGPPGFEVYLRIGFSADAGAPDDGGSDAVRTALSVLATCTDTPATGYAAVWEGWGGAPNPEAPAVDIPHRSMLLLTGAVDELRDAPGLAWHGSADAVYQTPHLVWPEDRAWCLACEVDEEIEFSVGCTDAAARSLERALPGQTRRVPYGEQAPLYLDQE